MELCWIHFSKTERNKNLSLLNLRRKGVLDELRISQIPDGYGFVFHSKFNNPNYLWGNVQIDTTILYLLIIQSNVKIAHRKFIG